MQDDVTRIELSKIHAKNMSLPIGALLGFVYVLTQLTQYNTADKVDIAIAILLSLVGFYFSYLTIYFTLNLPTKREVTTHNTDEQITDNHQETTTTFEAQYLIGNRVKIRNHLESLPETVNLDHLKEIAKARAAGNLQVVNTNTLNRIGISRFKQGQNAQGVINYLQTKELITRGGEWTPLGNRLFPSPTDNSVKSGVVFSPVADTHTHTH